MKVIAVVNGKGGVGKTTTAMTLAAVLARKHKTLLVDADRQGSATWWAEQGQSAFAVAAELDPEKLGQLRNVRGFDYVVIDTKPALDEAALVQILAAADYAVLPSPPAALDIVEVIKTARTLVRPQGIPHRVLLTKVDSRSINEALKGQTTLMKHDIPAFNAFVRHYKIYERCPIEGRTVLDVQGDRAEEAAADYLRVAKELLEDLERGQRASGLSRTVGA